MATIIAGRLQLQDQAEQAIDELIDAGFASEKVTSFYVNPPGQHAIYPIGGDRYKSPGEKQTTHFSEVVADVAEAVIGADHPHSASTPHIPVLRKAGMLVAVELADPTKQDQVKALFTRLGAKDIEKADGEITDGEWINFDPLGEPQYLSPHL